MPLERCPGYPHGACENGRHPAAALCAGCAARLKADTPPVLARATAPIAPAEHVSLAASRGARGRFVRRGRGPEAEAP